MEDRGCGRGGRRRTDRVYGVPGVTAAQKTGPGDVIPSVNVQRSSQDFVDASKNCVSARGCLRY